MPSRRAAEIGTSALWGTKKPVREPLSIPGPARKNEIDDDAGDLNADRLRLEVDVGPTQPAQLTAPQTDQREMPHVSEPVLGEGVRSFSTSTVVKVCMGTLLTGRRTTSAATL